MKVIGIIGTAKNTGKTTTLQCLLEEAVKDNDLKIGVTSIGYDGEWIDSITGLPKPRLYVQEDTYIATASQCLEKSSCAVKKLVTTDILTPLGPVVIAQVEKEGLLMTAGPNKSSDVKELIALMKKFDCDIFFIDGALNRVIPFGASDAIVVATGAAKNQNITQLALETKNLVNVLTYDFEMDNEDFDYHKEGICIFSRDQKPIQLSFSSLLTREHSDALIKTVNSSTAVIYIPGALLWDPLTCLVKGVPQSNQKKTIVLPHNLTLVLSGDLKKTMEAVDMWSDKGFSWKVVHKINLLGITLNPFYPSYRPNNNQYSSMYVCAGELNREMSRILSVPLFDLKSDGCEKLWESILTMNKG